MKILLSSIRPGWRFTPAFLSAAALLALVEWAGATPPAVRLENVNWEESQQQALSRVAQKTLSNDRIPWQHAETEHFVYHFVQRWMAERAAAEAETYYAGIKKDLRVEEDRWEIKAHIFLFETMESWKELLAQSGAEQWSGGFYHKNEMFVLSPPRASPFIGTLMPHELTHMVLERFVRGVLPVWLNEGVAEQQAQQQYYAYTSPKGFKFMKRLSVVSEENYIPLAILTAAKDYPEEVKKVHAFYSEALRLVQFLVEDHPQGSFLEFLQAIADGAKFESALTRVYTKYYSLESFEKEFRKVAISRVKLVE